MFDETLRKIADTQKDLNYLDSSLTDFKNLAEELRTEIERARRRYNYKLRDPRRARRVIQTIINNIKKQAPLVLIKHVDKATQTNIEFSNPVYRNLIYTAAQDESMFKFIPSGDGWGTVVKTQIVMEQAGTTDDYARGISLYREKLKVKIGKKEDSGRKATEYWLEKIYGASLKQANTVLRRVQLSGRKAPFWQLINSGSVSMPSDRGDGSYNPFPSEPTGFIDDTERELNFELSTQIQEQAMLVADELLGLKSEIETASRYSNAITEAVRNITTDFVKARQIINSLGKAKKYADENKLADAIRRFRAGEEFDRATIELTKRGSGGRARITARRLEGLL